MKKLSFIVVASFILQMSLFCQEKPKELFISNEGISFYPLAIGNKWIYYETSVLNPNITYSILKIEILDYSLVSNGKFYFHLKQSFVQYPGQYEQDFYERVDSSDGKVYAYSEDTTFIDNEVLIFDLNLKAGDTVTTFIPLSPNYYMAATSLFIEDSLDKWGITKPRNTYYQVTSWGFGHRYSLTQDIGLDYFLSNMVGVSGSTEDVLMGCVINGVIYGDTALVSAEEDNKKLKSFTLQQNYPNPFNPTTIIGYSIPKASFVTLKVYDILGREIATLVNAEKSFGNYNVDFNGNGLSSGIYFYKIQAGDYSVIKKMVLIK